jgi:hypothetical protein
MKHRKTVWKWSVLILCLGAGYIVQSGQISFRPLNAAAGTIPAGKPVVSYARLPLSFEANQGQTDGRVKYLSHGPGYTLFLTGDEVALALRKPEARPKRLGAMSRLQREDSGGATTSCVLRLKLVDANRNAAVTGARELPGKVNYFIGNDPKKWRTNVPTYAEVKYKDIYPGVDLVFYGNQQQLEHDFVVKPGAEAGAIAFRLEGSKRVSLDADGNLVIVVESGQVRFNKPLVYQDGNRGRRVIPGGYIVKAARNVAFKVRTYDHTRPLVIDPILTYSTYLGGSLSDQSQGIALDSSSDVYVTGTAQSNNFPTTAGAFQPSLKADVNAFVTKLNPSGSGLVYSTYLGGSTGSYSGGGTYGVGIALDTMGNAYLTGGTDASDFPTTPGAYQASQPGIQNAFVTKLNPSGSALVYSTYLGGASYDFGGGIALDRLGQAYVGGSTNSTDFPTTEGAFQTSVAGGNNGFVTKLNPSGSGLVYSTYLGGSSSLFSGFAITVDSFGYVYVTGDTDSPDFPTTAGAFQTSLKGKVNAFVTKLNPSGSGLVYSTYLGGSGSESCWPITVDSYGNVYVTGNTDSSDFPTTAGAFQTSQPGCSGCFNGFVTKLNSRGSALIYSTYLGGNGVDSGRGIAVDSSANAYVVGVAYSKVPPSDISDDFPTTAGAFQSSLAGFANAYFIELNPGGSALVYSTYLGGSGDDFANAIAVDPLGNAYVTGATTSTDFPTTSGAFQTSLPGGQNTFVAKFSPYSPGVTWQSVPGLLSQISVGSDGTVWGLNSAGQTYMFNSQTQTWQQAPGLLTQITAASSGVIWGLNAAGQIYRYDPASQSWDQIPGILSQLAVGSDGDVWGMNSSSQIYHFNAASQTWVQIPGALAQLAVGYDGAVWGLNAAHQIFRFNPGTQNWQQVAGLLKRVAVGADGDAWGINSAGQTFHFNTLSQQWQNTGASLAQLAVGSASNVWGLDSGGGIWCFNAQAQAWKQVPGQLAQLAVGENGAVWGLNSANQIYQFVQPTQATQTFHPFAGSLAQVAVGLDGGAWGIDGEQQVWHFNAQQQGWQQMPGSLRQIAVGFGGNVWGLNAAGQIWQFNPSTQGWNQIAGSLVQIAVGGDGSVWGIDGATRVWRFISASQSFQQIAGSPTQLSVGADGTVWGINNAENAGQIYRFNAATQGWDPIPGILSQIAVGSANNVWGVNAAGQVFRYDAQLQSWDSIPGALTSVAVAFDGTVWGLNSAQQIWRFNAQNQSWDSIAGQLTQIGVGADAVVWGVYADASGQTYEYW